jgi:hypothetical protein
MEADEVRRERCPACQGETFRNNFQLRSGHHARVFVECAACGALVARYILHAYVDPAFDLTSSLHALRRLRDADSWRRVVDGMAVHQQRAREQFEAVRERLDREAAERAAGTRPPVTGSILEVIRRDGILEDHH